MIPELLLDEETEIQLEGFRWAAADLKLDFRVLDDHSRWRIVCTGVSDWRIQDRFTGGLRIAEDDPVLRRSQFATYTTYCKGRPSDPLRAACDLIEAVPKTADIFPWSPNQLATLLGAGNGSVGSLPVPAIRRCEDVLKTYGVLLYHLGVDESETVVASSALLFGNGSFVIAQEFSARPAA